MSEMLPTAYLHPRARAAQLRVGDAERNAVCEQLSAQFAAGRLSQFELEDRLSGAMAAQTRFDLDRLTADLPTPVAALRPAPVPDVVPRTGWTALDVMALLVLLGALPIALLGAAFVVTGMGAATVWIAVLTTLVAGTIGATAVHLAHRSASRHDERIRSELRASGTESR